MPETNEMTCRVCGGTWAEPEHIEIVTVSQGPDGHSFKQRHYGPCPADCHDPAKWEALELLTRTNHRQSHWLELANGRIAELEKDREEQPDG